MGDKENNIVVDIASYNSFLSEFKPGTIYLKLEAKANEISSCLNNARIKDIFYCTGVGKLNIKDTTQLVFYGRNVTVGTIKHGNIVDGVMDFWHDYNNHNDYYYNVPNTEYAIQYDGIHNYTINLDKEYNLGVDCVPVFVPIYQLSELDHAYFLVGEHEYIRKDYNGEVMIETK
jgi:hypothetical protein